MTLTIYRTQAPEHTRAAPIPAPTTAQPEPTPTVLDPFQETGPNTVDAARPEPQIGPMDTATANVVVRTILEERAREANAANGTAPTAEPANVPAPERNPVVLAPAILADIEAARRRACKCMVTHSGLYRSD